jgi:hypothetical protein
LTMPAAIADYLAAPSVSHFYCSPYLQAARGSRHGYDVVDHGSLNAELGGEPAHARLVERRAALGLGEVLDIVPNHMALAGPRELVVVGRARERTLQPPCRLLRHRLEPTRPEAFCDRADADPRRPLRSLTRGGRTRSRARDGGSFVVR